jgi:hypothetical protein
MADELMIRYATDNRPAICAVALATEAVGRVEISARQIKTQELSHVPIPTP